MSDLPANQTSGFKLSLQEQQARVEHRKWIAGRVVTLLSHYWRDEDGDALTAAIAADWADVLEGTPQEYIRKACLKYARDETRRKPTPGAIYQLARAAMPPPQVVKPAPASELERERVDAETAQRICEEAGYTPRRFTDV